MTTVRKALTKLEAQRRYVGFTRTELARRSGVPLPTLVAWERGERNIKRGSYETLHKLAEALHCSIEEIVEV